MYVFYQFNRDAQIKERVLNSSCRNDSIPKKMTFSDPFRDFFFVPALSILCKAQLSLEKKKNLKTSLCSSAQEAYIQIKEQNATLEATEERWGSQGCSHCLGLQLSKGEASSGVRRGCLSPLPLGQFLQLQGELS